MADAGNAVIVVGAAIAVAGAAGKATLMMYDWAKTIEALIRLIHNGVPEMRRELRSLSRDVDALRTTITSQHRERQEPTEGD